MSKIEANVDAALVKFAKVPGAVTALILDDDPSDRLRLIRFCVKSGLNIEPIEVASIDEMRPILDQNAFDLIFIDYHLGLETGLDALKVVVKHPKQVAAASIMVTSVTEYGIAVEAMRSGCSDYLNKEELSIAGLRKSITSAIERKILLAALSNELDFRASMKQSLKRFAESSGAEMRSMMSTMLRRIRTMRRHGDEDENLMMDISILERSCNEMFDYLGDLNDFATQDDTPTKSLSSQAAR